MSQSQVCIVLSAMQRWARHVSCILFTALLGLSLQAATVHAEPVIVTISGMTSKTATGDLNLTLSEFEAIGMQELETSTPWHKEKTRFSGVSGSKLSAYLKVTGKNVKARALNDYEIVMPASDLLIEGFIFATRIDGKPMSVREKGPIFVLYPFDQNPELTNEVIFGRSIWQLRALHFGQ
ncbi:MAG: oxidoreductase [Rhodospirillales bacterium]|nr:oxidoreductase [Rhodospirillales bacterium]